MGYDDTMEAAEILARGRFALSKAARTASERERRTAAEHFVKTLCAVLQECGYQVRQQFERDTAEVGLSDVGWVFVTFDDPAFRVTPWDVRNKEPTGESTQVPISWDAATSRFAGTAMDAFRVPIPGQPRERRSAIAVMADVIVTVLGSPAVRPSAPSVGGIKVKSAPPA
jgi:hypothetical protein